MLTSIQIQQFRSKAKLQGFSDTQIEAEIYRKNQELSQQTKPQAPVPAPVSQPAPQPGMSVGGLAQNAGQDVLDMAMSIPQAYKNVAGTSYEAGRAVSIASKAKSAKSLADQQAELSRKIKAEKDTTKKQQLIAQSRDLSQQLSKSSQGLSTLETSPNQFVDLKQIPSSALEVGKGILKNIGRTFGVKQAEDGSLKFDLGMALQSAYERPVTTALLAKDLAGGVKGLTKKTATKEDSPNLLETAGQNLRKDVLKPQVKADPFYADNVKILQDVQKKLGLKGSAEVQLSKLPKLFEKAQTEIKSLLSEAKSPEKGVLKTNFANEIEGASYNTVNPEFAKAMQAQSQILRKLEGQPASALYDQLGKYRAQLKSAFKKVDRGTTLTPVEEARLASFNAIKSTIDTVSPEVRALNTIENQMYQLSKGLVKSKGKGGVAIPVVGKVGGTITQGIKDATGQALETVGGIPAKVGNLPTTPTGLGVAAKIGDLTTQSTDTPIDQPSTPVDMPTPDTGALLSDTEQKQPNVFGNLTKQEILIKAFNSGLNPKQIEEVGKIYDQLYPTPKAPSAVAQKEIVKANSAVRALDRLGNQLIGDKGDLSKVWKSKLPLAPGAQTYRADWGSVIDVLGGFRTGASYTKDQRSDYDSMLPQINDSPEDIKDKLKALREELQGYATMMKNTSGDGAPIPDYLSQ